MPEEAQVVGPVIAAFDFDGTLTRYNTFVPFLYALSRSSIAFTAHLSRMLPFLPGLLAGEEGRHRFKTKIVRRFFRGLSEDYVRAQAEQFFNHKPSEFFFPQALKRLEWHLKQGHACYLVSANVVPLLAVWIARYPRLQLLATQLESKNGVYTGEMQGYNCWGEEKLRRLHVEIAPRTECVLYAYGDSQGDLPLLARADYAHYRPFR